MQEPPKKPTLSKECEFHGVRYPTTVPTCRVCDALGYEGTLRDSHEQPHSDWNARATKLVSDEQARRDSFGDEEAKREMWELRQILDLGVPLDEAEALARRADVSWHDVERLIRRGCSVETAVAILS